ncbi:MAG: anthranilate synthase component I family protein [Thermoproteota archaeon]|nr:anthranilate synthase component I family protein [Thermoproteota archaeon]
MNNDILRFDRDRDYSFHLKKLETRKNPFDLFKKIYRKFERVFILESLTGPRELSEFSIIGFDPEIIVECDFRKFRAMDREGLLVYESEVNDPLEQLRRIMPIVTTDKYRFIGGAVGYVSYEAIRFWEYLPLIKKSATQFPLFNFGIYSDGLLYSQKKRETYYFYIGKKSRLPEIERIIRDKENEAEEGISYSKPRSEIDKNGFMRKVEKAREHIYNGDIFQVVLSRKFNFLLQGDPLVIYQELRKLNPSPYMYFLKQDKNYIIGSSPEMLLRSNCRNIETFPIAGTRPVTRDENINRRLRIDLLNDEKEIAEHTMLVDLARNDLGRVCKFGSVIAKKLMIVKKFSHVQHIVSHVEGSLDNGKDCFDAFKALFPAGTVTGAPKVRAMEIIDELEPSQRGPYSGAVGYFSFNKACDFAITIRSLFVNSNNAYVQAGAGIVMDSVPEKEWEETLHKAEVIFSALHLANMASGSKKRTKN